MSQSYIPAPGVPPTNSVVPKPVELGGFSTAKGKVNEFPASAKELEACGGEVTGS